MLSAISASRFIPPGVSFVVARIAQPTFVAKKSSSHADSDSKVWAKFPPRKYNTILNVCPQASEAVIETLGKFSRIETAGWFFAVPFFQKVRLVDKKEITIPITPQNCVTKDNVSVSTGGALYLQVTDSYKACYGAQSPLVAAITHARSAMRVAVGSVDLDTLFHNRALLNSRILSDMANTDNWGLIIMRYELTEVSADQTVSRAMDLQAVAERDRRKTILDAEAVKRKHELESEGQRQAEINKALGNKEKVVLAAEAEKMKEQLEAEGKAFAMERIAQALSTPAGKEAMNYSIAQTYLASLAQGMTKSSTLFLPHDVTNLPALIATGMKIVENSSLVSRSIPSVTKVTTENKN